ncbi:MAG TPA: exo-beta-N-acetylmuramidase NamZ domain-containing protein [Blastocatellia bacterium]|nr:exo-beta-N-acetylmuramidase NamZ domain-containing protein [Blastocatellia bacterium]
MTKLLLLLILLSSLVIAQTPATLPTASPSSVGMSPAQLAYIDQAVEAEIAKKQLPGAVVLVGRQGKVVWRRAYGNRALEPKVEPMTPDTIFDLASLTKVVATATSVMILVERGMVRLGDPVARYIPEFAEAGKKNITVEQLLVHRSGLMPDNRIEDYQQGPEKAFENIWNLAPIAETGSKFIYSDVNYIVLGELVRRVSGKPLDQFAAENIFRPLGMKDTGFRPAANLQPRIAPTEKRGGRSLVESTGEKSDGEEHWMRGEVHDPRSYLLGGVAGHAGLFSTADDLAIYCQMILNGGEYQGVRILSPLGVARMTEARPSGGNAVDGNARGIGWDIFTGYSANRGDLFPVGSFGHTGFTGTGLWLDPATQTFVVFLSNRVHPKLDPKQPADVGSLRGRVASIVAAALTAVVTAASSKPIVIQYPGGDALVFGGVKSEPTRSSALNGIDVLVRDQFSILKGRRIGLITNHTGRDREGRSTIDLLFNAPEVKLVALFSPEHGIRGVMDEKVGNSTDEKTGLPIYSLYGETRQPTAEMLRGIDTLVFDIQDIGARFYTYPSTLGLAMEAAAKNNLRFVVLDRVNPINGVDVAGPIADSDKLSFVAFHPMPIRHGMTVGELAQLFNKERGINADLHIVKVEDWRRHQWFDETGLVWINPSPNMRSLTEATLYPGVCLLEPTNVSVGRGTDTPFEVIGAPWIDGRKLAEALNNAKLPGVRFVPVRFTPKASVHKDAECGGVNIIITDRRSFEPVITGLEMAAQLLKLYPKDFAADKFNRLLVNQKIYDAFKMGAEAKALRQVWEPELEAFKAIRRKYLLY